MAAKLQKNAYLCKNITIVKQLTNCDTKYSVASFWLIMLINALWTVRYGLRVSQGMAFASTAAYVAVSIAIVKGYRSIRFCRSTAFYAAIGVLFAAAAAFLGLTTDLTTVNVDRWEIIQTFWNAVKEGVQPYSAQASNGNYPGPLPFYFIICYPFYLLKAYWLMPVVAAALIWIAGLRGSLGVSRIYFFLLVTSPSLYWEIMTGSTIYYNTVLVFMGMLWLLRRDINDRTTMVASAIAGGLLLATRQVFFIPAAIYFLYQIFTRKVSWLVMIGWGLIMAAAWVACFVPIILYHGADSFIEYNPFVVQDMAIFPFRYVIFFIIAAIATGIAARKTATVIFMAGLIMGAFDFTIIIVQMIKTSGRLFMLETMPLDLSYTIFAVPFLLYLIKSTKYDQ